MPAKHHNYTIDLTNFKQVKTKPAKYQCILCTTLPDGDFVMDKGATESHAQGEEHKRRAKEKCDVEWADWNAGAEAWGAPVAHWYRVPEATENKYPWLKREEEREREVREEKMKEVEEWVRAVSAALQRS